MFILIALVAIGLMATALIYLVEFARVSRKDLLFHPAETANVRMARRITGMHAHDARLELVAARGERAM